MCCIIIPLNKCKFYSIKAKYYNNFLILRWDLFVRQAYIFRPTLKRFFKIVLSNKSLLRMISVICYIFYLIYTQAVELTTLL